MLASFGKRVDDVIVAVQGNNLKKCLSSRNEAILDQIKAVLDFVSHPNLHRQGCTNHILLKYDPSCSTFTAANHIPTPRGEQQLMALVFPSFLNFRKIRVGESSASEQEGNSQDAEQVVGDAEQVTSLLEQMEQELAKQAELNSPVDQEAHQAEDLDEELEQAFKQINSEKRVGNPELATSPIQIDLEGQ
ncbi:hypothetical protein CsSME_00045715 [Camellia sinensis var. sinensis]